MNNKKQALLLLNMGGASNLDEIEVFLENMFADKNILPVNRYLRKFIANIIISKRLDDVKENYQLLGGKSPLLRLTNQLIEKLKTKLDMPIYAAMRYVPPFADEALELCRRDGVEELILFPMYPQYSTTTTLSSLEDIEDRCTAMGYKPTIRLIEPYYDNYDYITALAGKIVNAMGDKDTREYDLICSAHGLPVSVIKNGDPYEKQIESNVSALKMYLQQKGIIFKNIKLAYQSKVGPAAWLEPNLADVLRNPRNKKVIVSPLAFTIDNSETDYELDIEHREIADKIGFDDFIVAKCFNDDDSFVELIVSLVNEVQ